MTTKTGRGRRATAAPPAVGATAFDAFGDCGREQMAVAVDASCAMFRGLEAVRAIQQRTAQQAAARHEAAARRLRETAATGDLMSVPLGLLQEDLQSATRYWQELAAAAFETQTEVMGCTLHLFDADAALQSVSAVEALEAIPGMRSVFPAALALCGQPPRGVA
jgi:hypothetical protein